MVYESVFPTGGNRLDVKPWHQFQGVCSIKQKFEPEPGPLLTSSFSQSNFNSRLM
jgi:hypothetical protein